MKLFREICQIVSQALATAIGIAMIFSLIFGSILTWSQVVWTLYVVTLITIMIGFIACFIAVSVVTFWMIDNLALEFASGFFGAVTGRYVPPRSAPLGDYFKSLVPFRSYFKRLFSF